MMAWLRHGLALPFPNFRSLAGRSARDDRGTTAIEFALVATPFFMFVFGFIVIAMHFYTVSLLNNAVGTAGRQIRTGQAAAQNMTVEAFKNLVCENSFGAFDCDQRLQIHLQSGANWAEITPQPCMEQGQLAPSTEDIDDLLTEHVGGESAVVLVTACYEWELASYIPYLELGTMSNGSQLIQAITTFRSEPYGDG